MEHHLYPHVVGPVVSIAPEKQSLYIIAGQGVAISLSWPGRLSSSIYGYLVCGLDGGFMMTPPYFFVRGVAFRKKAGQLSLHQPRYSFQV